MKEEIKKEVLEEIKSKARKEVIKSLDSGDILIYSDKLIKETVRKISNELGAVWNLTSENVIEIKVSDFEKIMQKFEL